MRRRKFKNLYRGDVVYVDLGQHCTGKIKDNPVHIRVMPSDINGYFERESDMEV